MSEKELTITKEQFTNALIESGRFPEEAEDFELIDKIWSNLINSIKGN